MADLLWAAHGSDHASSSPLFTNTRGRFVQDSSFILNILATSQSGTCLIRSWQSPFVRFEDNLAPVFGALTSTNMSAADCPSMSFPADLDSVNGSTAPMPLSHHCAAGLRKTEATGLARENIIACIKRRNLNLSLWTPIPEVLLVNGRED